MLNRMLKNMRLFHDDSLEKVAQKLNVSVLDLKLIEDGKKYPTSDQLELYSEMYKISVDSILIFSSKKNFKANTISEKIKNKVSNKILEIMEWVNERKKHV